MSVREDRRSDREREDRRQHLHRRRHDRDDQDHKHGGSADSERDSTGEVGGHGVPSDPPPSHDAARSTAKHWRSASQFNPEINGMPRARKSSTVALRSAFK